MMFALLTKHTTKKPVIMNVHKENRKPFSHVLYNLLVVCQTDNVQVPIPTTWGGKGGTRGMCSPPLANFIPFCAPLNLQTIAHAHHGRTTLSV